MIVVGGDALALSTAHEIRTLQGHPVTVLWPGDDEFSREVELVGARFVAGSPEHLDSLERAGVADAITILAVSPDDQLNLRTALRARDANPRIRVVLRQFNRTLAHKIEQNLPDCSVVSLAWQSAATYAGVALDPTCFHGLQFPEPDGPLTGFAARIADHAALAGQKVSDAEEALDVRIVALDGEIVTDREQRIASRAKLVLYGTLTQLVVSQPRRAADEARPTLFERLRRVWFGDPGHLLRRIDPIFGVLGAGALGLFALGTWHFHDAFGVDWLTAAYFVMATMTTTGYGDITPDRTSTSDVLTAMMLMLSGIVMSGIFIAVAAALLTQARWVRTQGLRQIHRRGHIVVCGAGNIGTEVIDLLLGFDRPLVVIEPNPDPALIESARDRGFELLTGDASRDHTLDLCNLAAAHSLMALTNFDTLNLEIALGARARKADLPIVLRIAEAGFAASIARHFDIETTFSAAALAAPTFAGLTRFPGARGRVDFTGREFGISEVILPEHPTAPPAGAIPLAAARDGSLDLVSGFDQLGPGDRVLMLMPVVPLHHAREAPAPIAERVPGSGTTTIRAPRRPRIQGN